MNYIDLEIAIKYSYSMELYKKFISMFKVEYENFDLNLLDLSKADILSRIHKLKGITLNLGAKLLYDACLDIEESNNFDNDLKGFIYIFNQSYKELLNY